MNEKDDLFIRLKKDILRLGSTSQLMIIFDFLK